MDLAAWGVVALGASCGLRVFVAPFVLASIGVMGALGDGPDLFRSPWLALAATLLVLVEVAGDKFRGVDQALDAAGLVLRPLWAAAMVLLLAPAGAGAPGAALAATLALAVGVGKARLRVQLRADEQVAGRAWPAPLGSLAEDVVCAGLVAAALLAPEPAIAAWFGVALALHASATWLRRRRWSALVAAS